MCSLPLFINPWISADNPSADSAATVTASTNPAPLGIQTFLENVHLYIYSYIHISNIFVTVYALNARGSARNIWGLYYAKSKPRIRFFQRSPISDIENVYCPHTQIIVFTLRSPLFETEPFMSPHDHTEICIFFFSCFNLNNSTSGFSIFLSSNCYWILNACTPEWFFPPCLFTFCSTHDLPIYFNFFLRVVMM